MQILNSRDEVISKEKVAELPVPAAVAEAKSVEPRPSLEVEMDVHQHLNPRIHAHLRRMRAWDLRKLPLDVRNEFSSALDALSSGHALLGMAIAKLLALGFVAKTTTTTRSASKLSAGTHVALRGDIRETFSPVYTAAQLDSLTVVRVTDTHVQLMAGDSSNIGLVKICHVSVKT